MPYLHEAVYTIGLCSGGNQSHLLVRSGFTKTHMSDMHSLRSLHLLAAHPVGLQPLVLHPLHDQDAE